MLRLELIISAASLLVATAGLQADVTFDFEGLTDSTSLTNQYSGVGFTNAVILSSGISLNEFEFPPHSGVNVASDDGGPVQVNFTTPVYAVQAFFTYAQPITMQGFDGSHNLLGSVSSRPGCVSNEALSGTPGCPANELLTLTTAGPISSITITGNPSGGSFTMDDFSLKVPADAYQVGYAANIAAGDSAVNITNAGGIGGFDPAGNICANVYVFAEDEQLIACCTCPLTPNHLKTLSVKNDLISNTLTAGVPTAITIALLASKAPGGSDTCNAATLPGGAMIANSYFPPLVPGMRAWDTTVHARPAGGYGVTETEFSDVYLSNSELTKLTSLCGFIQSNGSGYGICNSCRQGALGGDRK